jgi:predicted nicotinamide N-methyase
VAYVKERKKKVLEMGMGSGFDAVVEECQDALSVIRFCILVTPSVLASLESILPPLSPRIF